MLGRWSEDLVDLVDRYTNGQHALALWGAAYAGTIGLISLGHFQQHYMEGGRWGQDSHRPFTAAWVRRRIPVFLYSLFFFASIVTPQRATIDGLVPFAMAFYLLKTYEAVCQDRFASETVHMKYLGCCASFSDIQERVVIPTSERLPQAGKEFIKVALTGLGTYAAAEAVARRGIIAHYALLCLPTALEVSARSMRIAVACFFACWYAYFSLCLFGHVIVFVFLLLGGIRLPALMEDPTQARSVREFWIRWDTVIQKLLRGYVYEPLRPRLGQHVAGAITFFSSGLLHVYPTMVALGFQPGPAASMMSYFLAQFVFMYAERELGIVKASTPIRFMWTATCLFAPSYALMAPVFQVIGLDPGSYA